MTFSEPSSSTLWTEALPMTLSILSSSMTAIFGCSGRYPTCEKPIFGSLTQPSTALGSRTHVMTFPVLPAGSMLLNTYHPFCANILPSNSIISESVDDSFIIRSGASGAMMNSRPDSSGRGSTNMPVPRSS